MVFNTVSKEWRQNGGHQMLSKTIYHFRVPSESNRPKQGDIGRLT
jgi:hypothetical protein